MGGFLCIFYGIVYGLPNVPLCVHNKNKTFFFYVVIVVNNVFCTHYRWINYLFHIIINLGWGVLW
jgi:hypothetical protein